MSDYGNISVEKAIKTVARFWSILSIALIMMFVLREGLKFFDLTAKEFIGFLFFPIGLITGFLIAWKNELAGSLLSLISILIFTLLMNANWFVVSFALPALLFFIHFMFFTSTKK